MPAAKASIRRSSRDISSSRALHGGNGNPVLAVDHLRRADLSASRRRLRDRHALSFGAGHPSGRRQAGSPRPHGQGGRPLAPLRLRRRGRSRRAVPHACELCASFSPSLPRSPVRRYTPAGADIDSVIDVRAIFQQGHRELAIEAMPAFLLPREGPLRASRLRKDVLPRPQEPQRHLRHAGHRSKSGLHRRRATGPVRRARSPARRLCRARGLLRRLHGARGLSSSKVRETYARPIPRLSPRQSQNADQCDCRDQAHRRRQAAQGEGHRAARHPNAAAKKRACVDDARARAGAVAGNVARASRGAVA